MFGVGIDMLIAFLLLWKPGEKFPCKKKANGKDL